MSGNRENLTLHVALIGSEFAAVLGCVLRRLGGCILRRNWLSSPWVVGHRLRPDHLCNNWTILFVLHDPGDCLYEGIGTSTNALASASALSSTMTMSISSPSFLMRAGLPACICSTIATALFSQRFRSHSSIASDPVWGGTVRSAGVPNAKMKALSGNVAAGMAVMAITARRMSLSFTSKEGDVFCVKADSEAAHSCCKANPGFGSI